MKKQEVDINININVQDNRKSIESNKSVVVSTGEKIKSHLSVSQLALFCRLMYDQEAISVVKQTDILKFIANNFQTQNAPEISARSLRSKYYNIDLTTKEAVKDMLNKMIKTVDNY